MTSFILIAVGVSGWVIFLNARNKIQAVGTWPTTPAIITESWVKKTYQSSAGTSGPRQRPMYTALVKYAYDLDGADYRHEGISPVGSGSKNPSAAQQTVERYPSGHKCLVYYNPARPQEAYLEAGAATDARLFAILGTLFIVVGLLLIGRV